MHLAAKVMILSPTICTRPGDTRIGRPHITIRDLFIPRWGLRQTLAQTHKTSLKRTILQEKGSKNFGTFGAEEKITPPPRGPARAPTLPPGGGGVTDFKKSLITIHDFFTDGTRWVANRLHSITFFAGCPALSSILEKQPMRLSANERTFVALQPGSF